MTLHEAVDFFNEDEINEKKPPNKSWKDSDMWKFTRDRNESKVKAWGGYIGKDDGYEPLGWIVDYENKEYYFGLDGHLIKTKAK